MNINPKQGTEKNTRTPLVKKMLPALLSTTLIVGSLVTGGYSASANGLPTGKTNVKQSHESSIKHYSTDLHSEGLKGTQEFSTSTEAAVSADVKISEHPWLMAKFHSFKSLFTLLVNKAVTTEMEAEAEVTADADTTYSEQKAAATTEKVEIENKAQTKQTSGSITIENEASANIQPVTTKTERVLPETIEKTKDVIIPTLEETTEYRPLSNLEAELTLSVNQENSTR